MSGEPPGDALDVRCPICHGHLAVDPETGEVLAARATKGRKRDFDAVLGEVKTAGERREKDFLRAFKVERHRSELLEKKFERAKREAEDDDTPPVNPLDLD